MAAVEPNVEREYCQRCRRGILTIAGDEPPVCTGCLTATEDIEETGAVVRLLQTAITRRPPDHMTIATLERAMRAVLDNLSGRLMTPDAVSLTGDHADLEPVAVLRPDDEPLPPR